MATSPGDCLESVRIHGCCGAVVLSAMPTFLSVQLMHGELSEEVVHGDAAYTACSIGLHH